MLTALGAQESGDYGEWKHHATPAFAKVLW